MKKKQYLIIIAIFIIGIAFQVYQTNQNTFQSDWISQENSKEPTINNKLTVHLAGEFNYPGIYQIEENTRVIDAIKLAGGATKKADLNKTNLAAFIKDGQKIHLKPIKTQTNEKPAPKKTFQKININKASFNKLCQINGVGPSIANKIILYRNETGPFKSINDIKKIKGISKKKFQKLKDSITI